MDRDQFIRKHAEEFFQKEDKDFYDFEGLTIYHMTIYITALRCLIIASFIKFKSLSGKR
jgi:hypothetical protein